MNLSVGDFGQQLVVSTIGNISQIQDLKLIFTKPDSTTVEKTQADGVAVGQVDIVDDCGSFLIAGTYLTYTIEDGLLDASGRWKVRAVISAPFIQETGSEDLLVVSS